jgi:hypothetical protein
MQHAFLFNLPPFSPISAPPFPFSASGGGLLFCEEKDAKEILGQDCGRLKALRNFIKGIHLYACPPPALALKTLFLLFLFEKQLPFQ